MDGSHCQQSTEDKMKYIKKEQQAGKPVAMMGDGPMMPHAAQAKCGAAMTLAAPQAANAGNSGRPDNDLDSS